MLLQMSATTNFYQLVEIHAVPEWLWAATAPTSTSFKITSL